MISAGLIVLLALIALTAASFIVRNVNYASWDAARVARAGFIEKQTEINGSILNYAKGPDNGPQRRKTMATIGYLTRNEDGSYKGELLTLSHSIPLTLVPIEKTKKDAPNWRTMSGRADYA
ncbi:DUF736 family protein [Mesorhizobium tianshanense]|nr:DUF736 family protein [Mesorhizobium tianshanense]